MGPISIGVGLSGPLYSLYFPVPLNGKVAEGGLDRRIRKSVFREKKAIEKEIFYKNISVVLFCVAEKK